MLAFAQTPVLPEADRVGALSARSCRSANGRNPPVKAPPQHTQAFWEMVNAMRSGLVLSDRILRPTC